MSLLKDIHPRDILTGEDESGLNNALFVKAGAGAGKTYSIKKRVLNLILKKGIKPEQMAIITYTTKAASELQARIRSVLEETLSDKACPQTEEQKALLFEALDNLAKAKISTVHSFCNDLLQEYPVEFNVDPSCMIADERHLDVLLESARMEYQRHAYTKEGGHYDQYKHAFEAFDKLQVFNVKEDDIFSFFMELFGNRDLTPMTIKTPTISDLDSTKNSLMDQVETIISHVLNCEQYIKPEVLASNKMYQKKLELEGIIRDKNTNGDLVYNREVMLQYNLDNATYLSTRALGAKGDFTDTSYQMAYVTMVKDFRLERDKYFTKIKLHCYDLFQQAYAGFSGIITELKSKQQVLDYFDCILLVRNGLKNNIPLRKQIQSRFKTLIVDEFQDSDPMQREIVLFIAEDDASKLVLVGDGKQSIYGFSRADIAVFNESESVIQSLNGDALELTTNFRSENRILTFINDTFKNVLLKPASHPTLQVNYTAMDLAPNKEPTKGSVERWDLNAKLQGESKSLKVDIRRPREAFMVSQQVKKLCDSGKYLPGDFMILFRMSTGMDIYEAEFERSNIPVVNTKAKDFLKKNDVKDMLSIISYLSMPEDNFFTEALRSTRFIKGDLPQSIQDVASSEYSLDIKFDKVCNLIGVQEHSLQTGDSSLLDSIENLKRLLRIELEMNRYDTKQALSNLITQATDSGWLNQGIGDEKLYFESIDSQAVRLMTVHAAKGLESKVVIMAGHDTNPFKFGPGNFIDRNKQEIMIIPPGLKSDEIDSVLNGPLNTIFNHLDVQDVEEEKRILYVGSTRAEEKLVFLTFNGVEMNKFNQPIKDAIETLPTQDFEFEDYESKFTALCGYQQNIRKQAVKSGVDTAAVMEISQLKPVSQSVTSLIEDHNVFNRFSGRKHGMAFGTFTHVVMESLCHLIRSDRKYDTSEMVDILHSKDEISFSEAYIKDLKIAITAFMSMPLAEEIKNAEAIHTELPFALKDNYHGIIDLIIEKDNELKLIDWKSDVINSPERLTELKEHYGKQMDYYLKAVRKSLPSVKVSGECIFLFGSLHTQFEGES